MNVVQGLSKFFELSESRSQSYKFRGGKINLRPVALFHRQALVAWSPKSFAFKFSVLSPSQGSSSTLTYTRAQRIVTPCSKTIHTRPRPVQDHPHRTPNPFVARRHLPLLQVSEYRFKNIFCTSELFLKMQHLEDIRNSSLNVV